MGGVRCSPQGRVKGRTRNGGTPEAYLTCRCRSPRRRGGWVLGAVLFSAAWAIADSGQGDAPLPLSAACRSLLCRRPNAACDLSGSRPAVATAGARSSVTFTPDADVWAAASEAGSSAIGGGAWEFVAELLTSSSPPPSSSSSSPSHPATPTPSIPSAVYSIAAGLVGAAGADVSVSFSVETAGAYHIALGLARAGGLLGAYYTNVWFRGDPRETRIDPSVSFGEGALTGEQVGVRWCGYLSPMDTYSLPSLPTSEAARGLEYTLTLELASASDSARLWVNGSLLIDSSGSSTPGRLLKYLNRLRPRMPDFNDLCTRKVCTRTRPLYQKSLYQFVPEKEGHT